MKKKLVLRADGNTTIGFGHVYRLLALADILKGDFEIVFAISTSEKLLLELISSYSDKIISLPAYNYTLPDQKKEDEEMSFDLGGFLSGDEIVVTDGYWFGEQYQKAVKKTKAKLVCIDDFAENYFYADAVINHAPGVKVSDYRGEPYTKYFLGLDYALLRKNFFSPFSPNHKTGSLLIGMGGSDPYGITEKVLNAVIHSHRFSEIHLLAPALFTEKKMAGICEGAANVNCVFHKNLNADALVTLMDNCKYAIVSASTLLLEFYSRGIICMTGYYTPNQKSIYNGFVNDYKAIGLGDLNNFEPKEVIEAMNRQLNVQPLKAPLHSYSNIKKIFTGLC